MRNKLIQEKIFEEALISERMNPQIWQWGYLTLAPLLKEIKRYSIQLKIDGAKNILDLGCGIKPYQELFSFSEKFVGFDIEPNDKVDFVGKNWDLPFDDNSFDALISTQVLEHTAKIPETINEIRRVVKNKGLVFISVPFVFPEHGAPYDYYRFTQYGLREIFKDFEVVILTPQGGYANTLFRLVNTFLKSLPFSNFWAIPLFFLNNLMALIIDFIALLISEVHQKLKIAYKNIYLSMPENYMIILRNTK